LKKLLHVKKEIIILYSQPTELKKICARYSSVKGLIYGTYKNPKNLTLKQHITQSVNEYLNRKDTSQKKK
jgi:hypothetical protein